MTATELTTVGKAQAVINTLELLDMPSTFDNVNKMTGIYQTMFEIQEEIKRMDAELKATKARLAPVETAANVEKITAERSADDGKHGKADPK